MTYQSTRMPRSRYQSRQSRDRSARSDCRAAFTNDPLATSPTTGTVAL